MTILILGIILYIVTGSFWHNLHDGSLHLTIALSPWV